MLWTTFGRAAEAAQGLIPVLTLRQSQPIPIASRNGEISYQPVLEITGWANRDPEVFGPRTVPPPQTRLGSDGAAAALAAPEPAELPHPVPVVLPPEQAAAAATGVPDPFAGMARVGSASHAIASPAANAADTIAVPAAAARPQF
jgi:hypothetical protein